MTTAFYVSPGYVMPYYNTSASSPAPSVPTAPTGLTHTNVASSGWTESWDAVSGASTYNVYVGGSIVQSGITGTSYTVTGRTASTTYTVTVTAVNAQGESTQSSADSVTTSAPASGVSLMTPIILKGSFPVPQLGQNAQLYVGTDWLLQINVTGSSTGTAADLTGASAEWVMQPNAASTSPTIKIDSVTVTDATNGVLEVSVGNADTTADKVMVGNYDHWVIVTDGTGKREPVTIGRITVLGLPS